MNSQKSLVVEDLDEEIWIAAQLAELNTSIDSMTLKSLMANGFSTPAHRSMNMLGWVWRQWLAKGEIHAINSQIHSFIKQGLELRSLGKGYYKLPQFDLFLLMGAIFSKDAELIQLTARSVGDSKGDKGETPLDKGELYSAAWSGMVKYWLLNDLLAAKDEANIIWKAKKDDLLLAAPKSLVVPWLNQDWAAFSKQQTNDFEKLWTRARKDGFTVKQENEQTMRVQTAGYFIGTKWCWAHCGLAILAHLKGAKVVTDPLWFPEEALKT